MNFLSDNFKEALFKQLEKSGIPVVRHLQGGLKNVWQLEFWGLELPDKKTDNFNPNEKGSDNSQPKLSGNSQLYVSDNFKP